MMRPCSSAHALGLLLAASCADGTMPLAPGDAGEPPNDAGAPPPDAAVCTSLADPGVLPSDTTAWDAEDIWVDSPANGFDYLEHLGPGGEVLANGDTPVAEADNRIIFRARNFSERGCAAVTADIYVGPLGFGGVLPDLVHLGSKALIVPASGTATASIPWPAEHTRRGGSALRLVLSSDRDQEPGNNGVYDRVVELESNFTDTWSDARTNILVANPRSDRSLRLRMHVLGLPLGWGVGIGPETFELAPGANREVAVLIRPISTSTRPLAAGDSAAVTVVGDGVLTGGSEQLTLGGAQLRVSLVVATTLALRVRASGGGSIALDACLSPPVAGGQVAFFLSGPSGSQRMLATADAAGCAAASFVVTPGRYSARAVHDGVGPRGSAEAVLETIDAS